jgi:hypothetical protein
MPAGRPRTVCPEKEELIKLGQEMVQWCTDNKPLHLCEWYSIKEDITDNVWDTMRKRDEFVHYYRKALKIVGLGYLDKDSSVDRTIKDRWQRVYFKDLKEEEDETARFLHSLKIEELEKLPPEVIEKYSSLMELMKKNQNGK